jgi:predicted Ser/Thr protein kinase
MNGGTDAQEPRMIGQYRLDGELGRGGMGVVYAAYDTQQQRPVALKVVAPEIGRDAAFAARFLREARIAVSLEHPNVVPVYETGSSDGVLFIAMRRVDGADLGKAVAGSRGLPVTRVVRLARQISAALDAAHAKGLVHRDVKPGNVLLTGVGDDEHAYLTDFGLAREAASETGLTNTGQWMGTADYVAPEQIEGGMVSAASDIYSFGCVLFQLLTGDVPYKGLLVRKLFAHSREPLPSIAGAAGSVSARIDEVLTRATAKQPAARFQSAGDLGRALAAAAEGRDMPLVERTVATGAALFGIETQTLTDEEPPEPVVPQGTRRIEPTAPARRAHTTVQGPAPDPPPPAAARERGPAPIVVALLAAAVLAVGIVGLVVLPGGSGTGTTPTTPDDNAVVPPSAIPPPPTVTVTQPGPPVPTTTTIAPPPPTRVGPAGRLPAQTPIVMKKQIHDLIVRFYRAQIRGQYAVQRGLLTPRYQRQQHLSVPSQYARWQRNQSVGTRWFRGASNITVEIVSRDPADGSVAVDVRGLRYVDPGASCSFWEGITWARYEGSGWLYDPSPQATSARRAEWANRSAEVIGGANACLKRKTN